jgi:hypothetical protein
MIAVITRNKEASDPKYVEVEQASLQDILSALKKKEINIKEIGKIEFFKDVNDIEQELMVNLMAIETLAGLTWDVVGSGEHSRARDAFFGLENLIKRVDTMTYVLNDGIGDGEEIIEEPVSLIKKKGEG